MQNEKLVKMVKLLGQEVIDRAEDLVGDGDMISDFDIWLRFPTDENPEIEVTRQHASRRIYNAVLNKEL